MGRIIEDIKLGLLFRRIERLVEKKTKQAESLYKNGKITEDEYRQCLFEAVNLCDLTLNKSENMKKAIRRNHEDWNKDPIFVYYS